MLIIICSHLLSADPSLVVRGKNALLELISFCSTIILSFYHTIVSSIILLYGPTTERKTDVTDFSFIIYNYLFLSIIYLFIYILLRRLFYSNLQVLALLLKIIKKKKKKDTCWGYGYHCLIVVHYLTVLSLFIETYRQVQ